MSPVAVWPAAFLSLAAAALLLPGAISPVGARGLIDVSRASEPAPDAGASRSGRLMRGSTGMLIAAVVSALLLAASPQVLRGPRVGVTVIVVLGAGTALSMHRRAASRRRLERLRAGAGRACELLVAELAAGSPPDIALQRVAASHRPIDSVVAASQLGSDVAQAMRRLAAGIDAPTWARVADAWEISQRSGAGLSTVLAQVAAAERDAQSQRRLVQQELADARATAVLMAVLPWLLVGAGSLGDGGAWSFVTGTWPGVISAGLGCLCAAVGLIWMERIERAGTAR